MIASSARIEQWIFTGGSESSCAISVFLIDAAWTHLYLFGFLYFLAPVLALFTIFLPKGALQQGGLGLAVYLVLVNLPYGIVTALLAGAIIGGVP